MAKMKRKMFHVIQFIELPYEMIDEYVCVPRSWMCTTITGPNRMIMVAYPHYEDSFTTKERVRKKEKPNGNWRVYKALHLYETGNYKDVNKWIAMKKDIRRKYMTINQSKFNKTANPVSTVFQHAPTESEYLKQKQSVIFGNDYLSKITQMNSIFSFNMEEKTVMSDQSASMWFPDEIQPSSARQNSTVILYRPVSVSEGGFDVDVDDNKTQSEPLTKQTPFFIPATNPLISDGRFDVNTDDDHMQFGTIKEEKPFISENIVEETEPLVNVNDRGYYVDADDGQIQSEPLTEQTPLSPETKPLVSDGGFDVNTDDNHMQFETIKEEKPFVPENVVEETELPVNINGRELNVNTDDEPITEQTPFVSVVKTEPYLNTQTVPYHTGFYRSIHQYPPRVDEATETNPVMDVNLSKGRVSKLPDESALRVVQSSCQTEVYLLEQPASCQETYSESNITTHAGVSSSDTCEGNPYANVATENRPLFTQNPQTQQRVVNMQEMLDMFGTMFAGLGAVYNTARDMMNDLGKNTIECVEKYESLMQKVEKYNKRKISENKNSERDSENNNIGFSGVVGKNIPYRHTSLLPLEYDPNDSKWTLKYKKYKPGLVELLPRANVYVSSEGLENCKRKSKDCRTLAQMLLTEVFSKKALSVCSWRGGEVFNSGEERPHLDMFSKVVLMMFVEQYGAGQGWNDQSGIINALCIKVEKIRAKYGKKK